MLDGVVPAPMEVEGGSEAGQPPAQLDRQALLYCERFVEFLTDLLSQVGGQGGRLGGWRCCRTRCTLICLFACGRPALASLLSSYLTMPSRSSLPPQLPTRRFVHAVLEDRAVLVKAYMSRLYAHPQGHLFVQVGWRRLWGSRAYEGGCRDRGMRLLLWS